ncbi:MAG TPA: DnaA regulatory inactivator Hda [Steroidobacteraceae bacterium]|nr:DnaA regulatory inactivator Hda [Steroidobacteraceae bacterium]
MRQLALGVRMPDRAVFASFFAAENAQAVAHLQGLARGSAAGVAWLCGPAGSGKTHLLQASCVLASEQFAAGYFPLRQLAGLGSGTLEGLERLDCVCLDDLDTVIGQLPWERQLFGLHRELEERGARLLVSAQAPPALSGWALPDLGSRLAAAAVFQLRVLTEAERTRALQLRARVRGLELPADTARWLQRRFPRNMHTLYELLDTLDEAALAERRRLTVPFIRGVLARRAQP